jgi:hypothetical protein
LYATPLKSLPFSSKQLVRQDEYLKEVPILMKLEKEATVSELAGFVASAAGFLLLAQKVN